VDIFFNILRKDINISHSYIYLYGKKKMLEEAVGKNAPDMPRKKTQEIKS